jgi:hypothetical protein
MCFTTETGKATGGVDVADFRSDLLQGGEGAALGFDLADDVFADGGAEVCGCAGEPFPLFH